MIKIAKYDASGRYILIATTTENSPELRDPSVYVGAVDPETQYHDVANNVPVNMPAKPGMDHKFNYGSKQWEPDLDGVRERLLRRVEGERDRRINDVISYSNGTYDADDDARGRIRDKLSEIADSEALNNPLSADTLVWRDHANSVRSFATQAGYKLWLQGLRIIIARRSTNAMMWSWQKKEAIRAAATLADLTAIDPLS